MKTVWLIRHGQSAANAGLVAAEPETIELTRQGTEQALQIAEKMISQPDLIVTSPFIRTLRTAEPSLVRYPDARHEQWPIHEFTYLSQDQLIAACCWIDRKDVGADTDVMADFRQCLLENKLENTGIIKQTL